jgi:integrase
MAGALKEVRMSTRGARALLPPGLHWRQLDGDIHLGYRKRETGGIWLVRWYIGSGNYHRAALGLADDIIAAGNLSFDQAARKAREFVASVRASHQREKGSARHTVRSAVNAYIEMRDNRIRTQAPGSRRRSDAASRLTRFVLSHGIASAYLDQLTEDVLASWTKSLAKKGKLASNVRTANDFKAALNLARRQYRKELAPDFGEVVKVGLAFDRTNETPAPRARANQILSDAMVRKIVRTAAEFDEDGDVGRMILVLAATGARFSQVQRITVGDVQADRQRIFVPSSRKGHGRVAGHYAFPVGKDVIDALQPALDGRSFDEPLLCRWRYVQVKGRPMHQPWIKDRRGPWTSASEIIRKWNSICESLGLKNVVPYALRHSSIVRAIRSGLPIRLVAAMHDTSVAMIERHYARYIVDGLEELAARAVVPLVEPASV